MLLPKTIILAWIICTTCASQEHILLSRLILPGAPLAEVWHYARNNLDESHPLARDLVNHIDLVARNINERRMALPLAYAEAFAEPEAKGGGGGKKPSGGGSDTAGDAPPPPGLNEDGRKALEQCKKATSNAGSCDAMRGGFARAGCALGSIHNMKPCENKNLQSALKTQYCGTADGKKNKKQCK